MRLLKEGTNSVFPLTISGEETDVDVSWEDQQNINSFSKLNLKLDRLEETQTETKREKEYLDDLSTELELADEDELFK